MKTVHISASRGYDVHIGPGLLDTLGTQAAAVLKGRKVCVVGPVSVSSYTANDGSTRFTLEVTAEDVEFLSSRNDDAAGYAPAAPVQSAAPVMERGFQEVDDEDLPF